jgi:hypothetical protein
MDIWETEKVDIAPPQPEEYPPLYGHQKGESVRNRTRIGVEVLAIVSLLAFIPGSGGWSLGNGSVLASGEMQDPTKAGVVYVCACLKNKSCFCMTEAKTEGPCSCGTEGGPPLKAVASDSAWAKENRAALSK